MLQNLNNPVAGLGIVPGKALLDDDLIATRRQNARNPLRAASCYPGGEDPVNHAVLVGDLVFGRRGQRDVESMDGEPNEYVFSSVSGLAWEDYNTHKAMEQDHYFVGVAAGEEHLDHPYSDQPDSRNGFGTVRVGTVSVINNGPKTFYPGDLVMWRFPNCGISPGSKFATGVDPSDTTIIQTTRYGEEPTKFRPEIVPFNPTDLSVELSGVFSTFFLPSQQGGVADIDFKKVLPNADDYQGGSPYTLAQDEGLAYKFGILGIFSAFLECAIRYGLVQRGTGQALPADRKDELAASTARDVLTQMGAFSTSLDDQTLLIEAFSDVFLKNIGGADSLQDGAVTRFQAAYATNAYDAAVITPQSVEQVHARMRLNAMENLVAGMAKTIDFQRSKIIGRCTSASAPQDTTDILLGHTF